MTVRKFWFAFAVYAVFFAAMVFCAHFFGWTSVFTSSGAEEDERFRLEIEQIPAREEAPFFALMPQEEYENFEDMIRNGRPELVVRVTLTERGDCTVYDPFGEYSDHDLGGDAANLYICTPYEARIEEVLLGDPKQYQKGDDFIFYAPYGKVRASAVRYKNTPIFSVGREYILFFSMIDVYMVGRWHNLVHSSAAVEIMEEDPRTFTAMTDTGIRLFEATGFDTDRLAQMLTALYEETPYSLHVPMYEQTGVYKK